MSWQVHHEGKVREWTESHLRFKLRKGTLSGIELAKGPNDTQWRPLHSTALFRDAVPHTGDPVKHVRKRILQPFLTHLTAFIAVMFSFWVAEGHPALWGGWWAIGVVIHAGITFRRLRTLPRTHGVTAVSVHTAPRLADSEVLRAIDELTTTGWSGDMTALRSTAQELVRRRALVDDAVDDAASARLREEREAVLTDREGADASTIVLLDEQLSAIDARLRFAEDVRQMGVRLRARERTLLHQVESLRLGQLRAQEQHDDADLMTSVTRLRRELDAEAEVTEALSRARSAQQA